MTVFYGHIHQEHHHTTGAIAHHAARSLIFPLPAPGSVPKKAPVPWDPAHPRRGLGLREVGASGPQRALALEELSMEGAAASPARVVPITAERFAFTPSRVELKVGEPVILELRSRDRKHGIRAPELGLDAVIPAGKTTRVELVPRRAGTFAFHCSVFCGSGHEDMGGQFVVTA